MKMITWTSSTQAPLYFVDILAYCNLLFTTLFTIECCLKVFALGPKVSIIQPSVKYPKPGKQARCLKQTCLSRTTSKTPGTLLTLSPWSGASSMWRNFSRLVSSSSSGRPGWSSCSGKILWYFSILFQTRNWGLFFSYRRSVSVRILLYTFIQSFKVTISYLMII